MNDDGFCHIMIINRIIMGNNKKEISGNFFKKKKKKKTNQNQIDFCFLEASSVWKMKHKSFILFVNDHHITINRNVILMENSSFGSICVWIIYVNDDDDDDDDNLFFLSWCTDDVCVCNHFGSSSSSFFSVFRNDPKMMMIFLDHSGYNDMCVCVCGIRMEQKEEFFFLDSYVCEGCNDYSPIWLFNLSLFWKIFFSSLSSSSLY